MCRRLLFSGLEDLPPVADKVDARLDSDPPAEWRHGTEISGGSQSRQGEADPLPVTTHFIIPPLADHLFHLRHANTFPVSMPLHQAVHDRFYRQKGAKIARCPRVTDRVVTIRSGLTSVEFGRLISCQIFLLFLLIRLGGHRGWRGKWVTGYLPKRFSLLKTGKIFGELRKHEPVQGFSSRSGGFRIKCDMLSQQGIWREHLHEKLVIVSPDDN